MFRSVFCHSVVTFRLLGKPNKFKENNKKKKFFVQTSLIKYLVVPKIRTRKADFSRAKKRNRAYIKILLQKYGLWAQIIYENLFKGLFESQKLFERTKSNHEILSLNIF